MVSTFKARHGGKDKVLCPLRTFSSLCCFALDQLLTGERLVSSKCNPILWPFGSSDFESAGVMTSHLSECKLVKRCSETLKKEKSQRVRLLPAACNHLPGKPGRLSDVLGPHAVVCLFNRGALNESVDCRTAGTGLLHQRHLPSTLGRLELQRQWATP